MLAILKIIAIKEIIMIKKCSNCGHENVSDTGNINYCEACGHSLKTDDDYEYNFGDNNNAYYNSTPVYQAEAVYQTPMEVPTKVSAVQLNKRKRDLTTGVIALAIFFFVRFITSLTAIGDIKELKEVLYDPYYTFEKGVVDACQRLVDSVIAQIVIGTICLILAGAMLIMLIIKRKSHFPVQDDRIFKEFSVLTYVGIGLIVVYTVYCILEVVGVMAQYDINSYFSTDSGDELFSLATSLGAIVADVIFLAVCIYVTTSCSKIAKSKA